MQNDRYPEYRKELLDRFWNYQRQFFPAAAEYFERLTPPVFHASKADHNVIVRPGSSREENDRLLRLLPESKWHKWFRSMNSSQALAQSVFGNLAVYDQLGLLTEVADDAGEPLLMNVQASSENFLFEQEIDYLGERRRTNVDIFFSGKHRVAIECKLTESTVGSCSRPRLKPTEPEYDTEFCDGTFTQQRGRKERCALTEIHVAYWKYVLNCSSGKIPST